jgi:hypothetical protein
MERFIKKNGLNKNMKRGLTVAVVVLVLAVIVLGVYNLTGRTVDDEGDYAGWTTTGGSDSRSRYVSTGGVSDESEDYIYPDLFLQTLDFDAALSYGDYLYVLREDKRVVRIELSSGRAEIRTPDSIGIDQFTIDDEGNIFAISVTDRKLYKFGPDLGTPVGETVTGTYSTSSQRLASFFRDIDVYFYNNEGLWSVMPLIVGDKVYAFSQDRRNLVVEGSGTFPTDDNTYTYRPRIVSFNKTLSFNDSIVPAFIDLSWWASSMEEDIAGQTRTYISLALFNRIYIHKPSDVAPLTPTIVEGTNKMVLSHSQKISVVNLLDGSSQVFSDLNCDTKTKFVSAGPQYIYYICNDVLYKFKVSTGLPLKTEDTAILGKVSDSNAFAVRNDKLYYGSVNGELIVYDISDLELSSERVISGITQSTEAITTVTAVDDFLYVGTTAGNVVALDNNLNEVWRKQVDTDPVYSIIIPAEDQMVAVTDNTVAVFRESLVAPPPEAPPTPPAINVIDVGDISTAVTTRAAVSDELKVTVLGADHTITIDEIDATVGAESVTITVNPTKTLAVGEEWKVDLDDVQLTNGNYTYDLLVRFEGIVDGNASITTQEISEEYVFVECVDDFDCVGVCVANNCVPCRNDTDCAASGQACSNNQCVDCVNDTDCAAGEVCAAGICEAVANATECTFNVDCNADEECRNAICVPLTTADPEPDAIIAECVSDLDCPIGEECVDEECAEVAECTDDLDCAAGEECVDGECVEEEEGVSITLIIILVVVIIAIVAVILWLALKGKKGATEAAPKAAGGYYGTGGY